MNKIFHARVNKEGTGMNFPTEHARREFGLFLKKNKGLRLTIEPVFPESRKQRNFYHGAVLPLWVYLDGKNYKDSSIVQNYHEIAKIELNGEIINTHGKVYKIGKTTRGGLNSGFLERVIDYLVENYGINPHEVLNPKEYQYFSDVIYGSGHYDTYIDYLQDKGFIHRNG